MKKVPHILFIFLLFFYAKTYGQPGAEKLSIKSSQNIQFVYQNIFDLTQPQEINNAIDLELKVKNNTYNIFAQVVTADPNYLQSFNNKLALRLQNHNSYNASTKDEVLLSENPALLFTQPSVEHTEHFDFYYNVVLYPSTTFISAGLYNFSIAFTMTKP